MPGHDPGGRSPGRRPGPTGFRRVRWAVASHRLNVAPANGTPAVLEPPVFPVTRPAPVRAIQPAPPRRCNGGLESVRCRRIVITIGFAYHPDPAASGSFVAGDGAVCDICGAESDWIYDGPAYGRVAQGTVICDACIASGRAADERDAEFTDLGGDGWEEVPEPVKDEVLHRTPGFRGWQEEQWQAHCSDAMVFLGPAGWTELEAHGPEAVDALSSWLATWGWTDDEIADLLRGLDRVGQPAAYVFQCRHCGAFKVYADFT